MPSPDWKEVVLGDVLPEEGVKVVQQFVRRIQAGLLKNRPYTQLYAELQDALRPYEKALEEKGVVLAYLCHVLLYKLTDDSKGNV